MNKFILFIGLLMILARASFGQDSARGTTVIVDKGDSVGTSYALVVGISAYAHINHLLYADDDADLFAAFLINEKICDRSNVIKLIDAMATTANFYKELTRLKNKVLPNDRVFIYFAGHGDVETDLESGFLLTYNCEANNYPATAIDISMLEKYVNAFVNKNAKVILITDACRSGNLAGGLSGSATTMSALDRNFRNTIKLLSCQPSQLSIEKLYPEGGHGVFTYNLIEGLSGLANTDDDSSISLREIGFYLDKVRIETNEKQEPKVDGDPNRKLVHFNLAMKMAVLAKKRAESEVAVNSRVINRGVEDSTWEQNKYYQSFKQLMRQGRYVALLSEKPDPNLKKYSDYYYTADFVIREAERKKQPAALTNDMKLELAAVLEDKAQNWINKYLRGEFTSQSNISLKQLENVKQYLETVEYMIGEKDFRYTEIHVKKMFFNAYITWKKADSSLYYSALRELESADKILPNQAWIHCLIGILESELDRFDEAETSFKKAIRLSPTWSYPENNLGLLYLKFRKYTEAEDAFNEAILYDSSRAYLWNNIGTLYMSLADPGKAEPAFRKAISLDTNYTAPLNNLAKLLADLEQYHEAEILLKKALKLDARLAVAWYNLGMVYRFEKKLGFAEKAFNKAFKIDPKRRVSVELLVIEQPMMMP